MNEFIVGAILGALAGAIVGALYDYWRVNKVVDYTILKYRCEEQKRKNEALKKFMDDQDGDE